MPELPEVETVRRGLAPFWEGARITHVETRRVGLRYPFPVDLASRLQAKVVKQLSRRAKYLLVTLEDESVIISHLGMSGTWRIKAIESGSAGGVDSAASAKNTRHDHLLIDLMKDEQPVRAIYNDPRRFGFLLLSRTAELGSHPMLKNLGVEPLGNALSHAYLAQKFANKKVPLKSALLDQTIIAGLGNIYVCEALWRAGLSPWLSAQRLANQDEAAQKALVRLVRTIRSILAQAIEAGGSTLRDYAHIDGSQGYFQHVFNVYGREGEPCPQCGMPILRFVQSGRSTFYCANCQNPERI